MSRVWISKIKTNDESEFLFDKNDIIVFVGPNNSGKSVSLREIQNALAQRTVFGRIIKSVEIETVGSTEDVIKDLKSASKSEQNIPQHFQGFAYNVYSSNVAGIWEDYKNGLRELLGFFVNLLSTEGRIAAANPPQNIQITFQPPQHPIHFLQRDDSLEKRFSEYFRQAFGLDLIIHRNAGASVPLYIGEKPELAAGEDRISSGYLRKLENLPRLVEQGDGMRSFVGVLLNAFVANHSILLIDEPEAFLHPPQARLLGKMLSKDLPTDRQLFLATHSEDFLKGLLDSGSQNIKVIRIKRNNELNKVNELNKEDIKNIWQDSLLRHSNILSGLFHSKVIICESDSDCRFYSAVLASIFDGTKDISPDVLFLHCGGKHRIPVVIKALNKLGVPIHVVSDFDILNEENLLKEIFTDLNGNWGHIENDWKIVKKAVDQRKPELEKDELKKDFDKVLEKNMDKILSRDTIQSINGLLKKASPWSYAKEMGKAFLQAGDQTQAFERLNIKAKEVGLEIVEVGELESFVKSIGNHGPKWVNEVLRKDLKNDPELIGAREFVKRLV